ncbi:MAG: helix-turn-helix domain-containing protein [Thermodesulfobacteriota bacterium]|nr:helix-turn-helix domain-containing protein [Thermodesulfobacteriota bacterium]
MTAKIDHNNFKRVGRMILFHRKKADLSRIDLAMVAGVGKTVIYDIEHGKDTVRIKTLIKILNALNITMFFDSPIMNRFMETKDEKS